MFASVRLGLTRGAAVVVGVASVAAGAAVYAAAGSALLSICVSGLVAALGTAATGAIVAGYAREAARAIESRRSGGSANQLPRSNIAELEELGESLTRLLSAVSGSQAGFEQERRRLLAALDASADGVVGIDAEEKVCFANSAAERLFSRAGGDFLGKPFAWLLPSPEVADALRASQATGQRQVCSVEGPKRQFLRVVTTPTPGDREWAAMVVFHDFTEVRRTEQIRRDFVANVSHELRTPLASIRAVLETLADGAMMDPAAARDFIARAQTEVDRLTNLVAELLELSRIESGDMPAAREDVDVGAAVRQAVERLRSQAIHAGVNLSVTTDEELPPVIGDIDRLERAVMNLVQNALKFTPYDGHVSVSVCREGPNVLIQVRDDGSGIDDRDLPRIFERFYKADNSRRTVGSGLGLALVKHTAEALGGSVTVESQLGRGSKFTISLPSTDRIPSEAAGARGDT